MTVASQRVQIALYGLQLQDAAVTRAAQRLDAVRSKRAGAETNQHQLAAEVERMQAELATGTLPKETAGQLQYNLTRIKSDLDAQTMEVQTLQIAEAEAANQLANDQAKLAERQERIERLDKTLANLSNSGK